MKKFFYKYSEKTHDISITKEPVEPYNFHGTFSNIPSTEDNISHDIISISHDNWELETSNW